MLIIEVKDNQTLYDFTLQHCGSMEALVEVARLNGLSVTDEITPGQSLQVPEPYNKVLVNFYINEQINIANKE